MKHAEIIRLPLLVRNILMRCSDSAHLLTMTEIREHLEDMGLEADRRSVYKAISVLNESGEEIFYETRGAVKGYWMRHPFSPGEALFLIENIQSSAALSRHTTAQFSEKILSMLSENEQEAMPPTVPAASKTDNDHVLQLIEILLQAASGRHPVEFRYYDLTVTKKKQYRRQNRIYHLVPYAIVSSNGRYYCVFYSEDHHSFANYRIDKMDMVRVLEEQSDPVFFSLADHIRSSFNMYHGEPETITLDFDLNLSNVVFDEFGKDIIISKVTADRFTASIRTSVTPTLISWLLQFYDRMEIRHPASLIEEMNRIADRLHETYGSRKEGE